MNNKPNNDYNKVLNTDPPTVKCVYHFQKGGRVFYTLALFKYDIYPHSDNKILSILFSIINVFCQFVDKLMNSKYYYITRMNIDYIEVSPEYFNNSNIDINEELPKIKSYIEYKVSKTIVLWTYPPIVENSIENKIEIAINDYFNKSED